MLVFVLNELECRKGTWPAIAKETELEYSWLTKLAQGRIPDPSVNKIQKLANHFRGQGQAE